MPLSPNSRGGHLNRRLSNRDRRIARRNKRFDYALGAEAKAALCDCDDCRNPVRLLSARPPERPPAPNYDRLNLLKGRPYRRGS